MSPDHKKSPRFPSERSNTLKDALITGALGFIGSNFVRYALTHWDSGRVINLDSMSYGANSANLGDIRHHPRYRFVRGSIADKELVLKLIRKVGLVINFAAETHVDRSIADPGRFMKSNVTGTFTLLEASRRSNIEKLVQISTDEVYGSAPNDISYGEDDRLQASSPYAATKAAADMLVQAYHKTYGLKTSILRSTNNFGPYQFPEKFIPKVAISALLGKRIPIYGRGTQIRDWTYVLDFCSAIELAVKRSPPGAIYNVSTGNEIPNKEIAKMILRKLGKSESLLHFGEDRPGHDYRYSLRSERIRRELGWKPKYEFDKALRQTVQWYAENASWWRPLIGGSALSATPWKLKR